MLFAHWGVWLLLVLLPLRAGEDQALTPENHVLTRAMAEKGDSQSQYQMGLGCYEGKAFPKDMAEACKWLTLAAGQGEKRALTLLQEIKLFATPEEIAEGQRRAAAERQPTNRLTVALLGWENKTGNAAAAHWREAEDFLIGCQLGEVRSLRILSSVGYGLRQLKKKSGDPLKAAEARKLGELIEARRVIWGRYQRERKKWVVTVRVLNVATGKASKELRAASTNWYEVRDQLTAQILKELGVIPTAAERQKMARRTTSEAALEWLMKAGLAQHEKASFGQVEQYARQAVAADPQCVDARLTVATALGNQGKMEAAEKEVREALKIKPDESFAHMTLGVILFFHDKFEDVEKELEIAAKLDPDDSEPLNRLGQLYCTHRRLGDGFVQYQKAMQLDPFKGAFHAQLGYIYVLQQQREEALAELKEAERLGDSDEAHLEQILALAYYELHEAPLAAGHLERLITLARKQGLNPELVKPFEVRWQEMKARLAPGYVSATPPKDYTTTSLAETLRQKLTKEEFGLATNPLACTPAMNRWAQELTKGATNDLNKARLLFDGIARRLNAGRGGSRPAQEVFAAWNDPNASFRCQEYAFLYVALARAVGLRAYVTDVQQEAAGENVLHVCAGICFADKTLLVDPAYLWFGAPHKKFTLLDDMQTVSAFLGQLHNLRLNRIAAKLCPDSAMVQFNFAMHLMNEDRWEEARQVLATALKLEPDGYMANLAKANLAMQDIEFDAAIGLLNKASAINATEGLPRLMLAQIYIRRGKLSEARDELRRALRSLITEKNAEFARSTLAELNEQLDSR